MEFESCINAPSSWKRVSIQSICSKFTSGGTPSRKEPAYFVGGVVPWIKTKELLDCVLDDAQEWITEKAISSSSAKRLPPNTVLMAMYGATVGQLGVISREMTCNQACAAMVVDDEKCDYRFLYYQLLGNRRQIVSMATGAAQQNLSGAQIKQWVLPLPSRDEQRAISDFLWSLDGRIRVLRQTNATLECIARALFKSWFVDFDPVHAKSEGRDPIGMDHASAELFPDEFERSDLGPIPKGWSLKSIGDCATVVDCLHARKPELIADGKPYLQLNCIRDDGLLDPAAAGRISDADYKKWTSRIEVRQGDCVITNVGRVGAVAQIPSGFAAAIGRNMTGIRPKSGLPPTFLIELLTSESMRREIQQNTDAGTILNALNVKSIPKLRFVYASADVLSLFEAVSRPLRSAMEANLQRSNSLAALRDTLLPRLVSGKLRLPLADSLIEGATA